MPAAARAPGPTPLLASGAMGITPPWQTITTGQGIDVTGFARAAGAHELPTARRVDLRLPAAGVAVAVVMELVIALVSGGDRNVPLLALCVLGGVATVALGAIAGSANSILRKLTAASALVFGVVQLAAFAGGAFGALSDPASPLMLVASLVAVVSGVVLAAVAGFRR